MLVDMTANKAGMGPETQDVLYKMASSPYKFHLTGSRFMGQEKPNSDWDFITEFSPELMEFLETNGFYKMGSSAYNESKYLHSIRQVRVDGTQIQIQITRLLPTRLFARDEITKMKHVHVHMNTTERNVLWNLISEYHARINNLNVQPPSNTAPTFYDLPF
jgi:hypothetical protein